MKRRNHGLDKREMELVKLLMADSKSTGDIQAKLKKLFAGTIEQMLEVEMDEHLGYEKNSVEGNNSGNSRNGYGKKTISSDYGDCEIARSLNRSNSSVSREFTRNSREDGTYSANYADKQYAERRKNCGRKHILEDEETQKYVIEKLDKGGLLNKLRDVQSLKKRLKYTQIRGFNRFCLQNRKRQLVKIKLLKKSF